ncbi:methyltransferase domain-containing protein [Pseudomonas sp. Fl5BN2]|uniref:class I SAM-dependent methyltransferase n=1 Tax=unclassified Pseudomonas TaxID=196821 RepID=UPI0013781724|nr:MULTISPECIES: class I SAM-dependent methyltransferase [unclassified Pseudomonas]NBF01465.1 methyltransferase domain-containing protein [Pseudomonas sp. Fl5BN2]NBF08355.1 methyltransferase domain-containing protein [Pseudomonas sp. Fl4BN1]
MAHELYRVADLPVLQNRTFADAQSARASASADIVLVQDLQSGLIFNQAFDADKLSYDSDYQNEQAHSAQFQRHLKDVEGIIARHFKGRELIEVGCGKGYFLELLRTEGYAVTGIDPAYEGTNPEVIKAPFTRGLGLAAEAIVLRHVLEHIADPQAFLAEIADANQGGQIYIEVPCFDWILEHRAWFDVFYEHVNYFRLEDLQRMFGTVHEAGHLFGGQYLYVVADLGSLQSALPAPVRPLQMPADFTASIECAKRIIQSAPQTAAGIWGASSKGVIYSLFLQRAGVAVDQVVDINPAKQGRYLPLSGMRVSSPQEAMEALPVGANLFVMNSNYLEEIKRMTDGRYVYHAVDSASFS